MSFCLIIITLLSVATLRQSAVSAGLFSFDDYLDNLHLFSMSKAHSLPLWPFRKGVWRRSSGNAHDHFITVITCFAQKSANYSKYINVTDKRLIFYVNSFNYKCCPYKCIELHEFGIERYAAHYCLVCYYMTKRVLVTCGVLRQVGSYYELIDKVAS